MDTLYIIVISNGRVGLPELKLIKGDVNFRECIITHLMELEDDDHPWTLNKFKNMSISELIETILKIKEDCFDSKYGGWASIQIVHGNDIVIGDEYSIDG